MRSQRRFSGIAALPDINTEPGVKVSNKNLPRDANQNLNESAQTCVSTNGVQKLNPELIYMGRLPKFKKLKMWIRSKSSV
jgi:hypothetical protein